MLRSCLPSLLCLSLTAAPLLPTERPVGPHFPPMARIDQVKPFPYWVSCGMEAVLRDVPGAVVAVEERFQPILDRPMPKPVRVLGNALRVGAGRQAHPMLASPIPEWNDPGILRNSAGNIVHRVF